MGIDRGFIPSVDAAGNELLQRQSPMRFLAPVQRLRAVDIGLVMRCESYRDAVVLCFAARARKGLHASEAAAEAGIHPPHMSDYLCAKPARDGLRDLPAKYIPMFEAVCGNTAISQWLACRSGLDVVGHPEVFEADLSPIKPRRAA